MCLMMAVMMMISIVGYHYICGRKPTQGISKDASADACDYFDSSATFNVSNGVFCSLKLVPQVELRVASGCVGP